MRLMIDSWVLRRWLCWPWCAFRRHREAFFMEIRWNDVPTGELARCSCGRRERQRKIGAGGE